MYCVGSIIIVRNIVFKNGNKCFDHSYRKGRPCLIISLENDRIYFLTLSSNLEQYHDDVVLINDDRVKKKSVIKIENIYDIDAFYYEEVCRLSDDELLDVLSKLYEFQSLRCGDAKFLEIKDDIQETITFLTKKITNKKGFVKCKIANN